MNSIKGLVLGLTLAILAVLLTQCGSSSGGSSHGGPFPIVTPTCILTGATLPAPNHPSSG